MGGNQFCLKACDPRGAHDAEFCQHIFDTQGCQFNAPSGARDGVFESCASDNQAFPGQGPAVPPASSLCSTFASTDIYGPTATVRVPIPGASTMSFSPIPRPTPSTTASPSPASTAAATSSRSGTAANATATSAARASYVAPGFGGVIAAVLVFLTL